MTRTATLFLLLALPACAGTSFEWDNAKQVRVGTTQAELVALMGRPYVIRTEGDKEKWVWSYANAFSGTRFVSFELKEGKVIGVPNMTMVE